MKPSGYETNWLILSLQTTRSVNTRPKTNYALRYNYAAKRRAYKFMYRLVIPKVFKYLPISILPFQCFFFDF
jgi:hypothetical protein